MRTQTKLEFSHHSRVAEDRKFYVPSDEETQAHAALQSGSREEALRLFDDAILKDPDRGARIYWTLNRAGAPLQDVYWGFCKADLEQSCTLQRSAVDDVRERHLARTHSFTTRCARWITSFFVHTQMSKPKEQ